MQSLDYERLEVYKLALDFVVSCHEMVREVPSGYPHLIDQLERASVSVSLNIAEGAGEFSKREKARFYRMARRSATESAAILEILARLKLADATTLESGRNLLIRIISMLVRMILNLSSPTSAKRSNMAPGTGKGTGKGRGQ